MRDVKEILDMWCDDHAGPEVVLSVFCMKLCELEVTQNGIRETLDEVQNGLLVQQAFDDRQCGALTIMDKIMNIAVPLGAAMVGAGVVLYVH